MVSVVHKVNRFIPSELSLEDLSAGCSFYKIDILCFEKVFESSDYSESLHIASSVEKAIIRKK